MATRNANAIIEEFDDAPTIEEFDDAAAPAAAIEEIDDEVVAEEAQRATAGAVQALDVMAAPRAFDWSEVNEQMDAERFREAEGLRAQGQPEQAAALLNEITPFTTAGQYVAQQRAGEAQGAAEAAATQARGGATPSEALRRGLGPGLSATVQPVVESGLRNVGAAAGGALAAAKLSPTPIGLASRLSTALGIALPIGGSIMGAIAGGSAQEALMQIGETPKETQRRQQLAAEAAARDPGLTKLGGAFATLPFFGPSLAQFGRAAAGDVGAATNIALSGTIGAGVEVGGALLRGDTMSARDIAEAFALNAFLNEPTKLGRKLGLKPSSEQQAVEDATIKNEQPPIPIGPTSEVGVVAGMRQAPSAIPRREAPKSLLSPDKDILSIARNETDALPRNLARSLEDDVKGVVIGAASSVDRMAATRPDEFWKLYDSFSGTREALREKYGDEIVLFRAQGEGSEGKLGNWVDVPKAALNFASQKTAQRYMESGRTMVPRTVNIDEIIAVFSPSKSTNMMGEEVPLKDFYEEFIVAEPGLLKNRPVAETPAPSTRTDEQRIAELVAAGMTPEEAAAGVAQAKAAEAPPAPVAETPPAPVAETSPMPEEAAPLPAEPPVVEDPKITSIKNAVTAAERAAREIPQAAETDRRAWTKAWDEAKAETPAATDALLAGLEKKAKPLSDKQHAMLLHRQIELQKAYDVTAEEVNRAAEAGDEPLRLEALERLNNTRDALQKVYDVEKAAGAESGRGLAARKMWANQDFELVPMEMRLRADNGGRLSEEQAAQVKAQADTIAKTQAEMDRILAENNALKAQVEADKAVDPKVKSLADRIIARLDLSAANAAKSLRSRLANLGAAPDPLIVLDVAKIAAAKTAKGAIEFAQWSAEMVKEFGEKIRPFLQAGWDRRDQIIDAEIGTGTKATKAAKASTSVLQENRRLKALTRLIVRAEAELAGAARRGKQQGPESQPVAEARQKLKVVREQLQAKREADPAVRQAKIEAAETAVEKAIRMLDEQLQAGDIAVKRAPSKAGSQRLEDLRLQRDAMNRLRNELRAEARPKADPIEAQVKGRLTAIANRTAEYNRRAAEGDFSPMRKPPLDLSKNPEWVKAKAANDAAKAAYEKSRYEARKAQRTTEQKVRDTIADVWSASRPILASTDISAPGRQGIFFSLPDLFTNPVRLGRQLRSMFRSQFSESKFQENEAAIKSRDNADLYEESDLYLADIDHKPSAREEQFKSELAEKIPGIGRIVRGSSRGFSSFMNTVRADAMDAFVKWSGGRENINPETAKFLAAAINDLSGRGNVTSRQAQGALEWLAKYLFSPRLWVSRFNTAILKPVWRDPLNRAISPRSRAVVFGQYAKFMGALLGLKFLAGLWGGKVEEDPRDSDFGKLQFGSKRYDVTGGIGNMVTLLARVSTQKTKDDKGKLLRIAWEDEKRPERELGQILFNHLRNKGAPIPGAVYDYIYGRHPDRSKVTPTSMLKQTTVPITVSDTVEFFRKDNPAAAMRDTLINALGVSVNDYRK